MPAKGGHQPQEAKDAIRAFHKGREKSPEHLANLAASLRGKKRAPRSEETKRKIRDAQIGRKKTPEQIEKNRISHIGQPSARKGVTLSQETIEKIRLARSIQGNPKMNLRGITQADMDEAKAKGLRWCAGKCKAFIPATAFYRDGASSRTVCTDCGIALNREYTCKKYGVDAEWYDRVMAIQEGRCALCPAKFSMERTFGRSDRLQKGRLSIDHDHEIGNARGLLCTACNLAIHRVEYVKGWSIRAIQYLLAHGSQVGKERKW